MLSAADIVAVNTIMMVMMMLAGFICSDLVTIENILNM